MPRHSVPSASSRKPAKEQADARPRRPRAILDPISPRRRPWLASGVPESSLRRRRPVSCDPGSPSRLAGLVSAAAISPRRRPEPFAGRLGSGASLETEWGSFVAVTSLPHLLGDTAAYLLSIKVRKKAAAISGRGNLRGKVRRRKSESSNSTNSVFQSAQNVCELQTIRFRYAGEECAGVL